MPVSIQNGTGTYDARSDNYTDIETFKNDVMGTTGARDMQNSNNTVSINITNSRSGDMILNRNKNGNAGHVQVITSSSYVDNTDNVKIVTIAQGNTGIGTLRGVGRIFNTSSPSSSFYTGQPIEKGSFNIEANVYTNFTKGRTSYSYSTTHNIDTRRWNFINF